MPARLLTIAGSDSSGGAGLQADIKTASAYGVYAMTAVTAVTVQNTMKVSAVHAVPAGIVAEQIRACLDDIGADAIKIGMLVDGKIVAAVADMLDGFTGPVVLDPVISSSSGTALLNDEGIEILKARLLPRAMLVTPNMFEAARLTRIPPDTFDAMRIAAAEFGEMGVPHVLFKGGHGSGKTVIDSLVDTQSGHITRFESQRIEIQHTHGTGCTLASAIACGLAQGQTLIDAVGAAHAFVHKAICTAPGLGKGNGPLNHQS